MEIFTKNKNPNSLASLLLRGGVIALVIMVAVTLAIEGARFFFDMRAQEFQGKRQAILSQEERALEQELEQVQSRISDFSLLLSTYRVSRGSFDQLESMTHPQVQIINLSLDPITYQMFIEGEANTFVALSQQLELWNQRHDTVENVAITDIGFEAGSVTFRATLTFTHDTFLLPS